MVVHRWMRNLTLASLLGATLIAPLSVLPASARPQAAKVATLIVGWDVSEGKSLDPGHMYEFTGQIVDHAAYNQLVTFDGGDVSDIKPDLATSWTVTGGSTVFTFKLRQGVKFASGNPFTADDVVFSWMRLKNLGDNPSSEAGGVKSVKALDPFTVQVTLSAPDVSFLAASTTPNFGILDSKLVKANGGDASTAAATKDTARNFLDNNSAGTGPYMIKEWTRNTRVVLVRNPNYWGTAPYFQEVILNGTKSAESQQLQLEKGDADIAFGLTNDQVVALKGVSGVQISSSPTLNYVYLAMNTSASVATPFSNPLVRQAVRYAIDYNGIINNLLNGQAVQPATVIPVGYVGNDTATNDELKIKTDLNKAKALLAQAGYPHGFSVTLSYGTNYSFSGVALDPLAAKIIHDLRQVGINLAPRGESISVALANYRARKAQIVLMPWGVDFPDAYDNLLYFGPGGNVGKRVNYLKDGNLADLILKGDATADTAARAAIYKQVQRQLLVNGPYAVLAQPDELVGLRSDIKGFVYSPSYWAEFNKLSR